MPSKEDEFILHKYCKEGSVEDIDKCLDDSSAKDLNRYDKRGCMPIHYAVKRDTPDTEIVLQLLISNDADINARTLKDGDTPLHIVVERYEEAYAILLSLKLLSHGADMYYRNDKQRTPYDIAMARNLFSLVEYLSTDLDPKEADDLMERYRKSHFGSKLIKAVLSGNSDEAEQCVMQGADPDVLNENGAGAIHYTVTHCPSNKVIMMGIIIDAGANANLQDYEGDTALNLVIKTSSDRSDDVNNRLVKLLLEAGADVSIKDADGNCSSRLAKKYGLDAIQNLIMTVTPKKRQKVKPRYVYDKAKKESIPVMMASESDDDDNQHPDDDQTNDKMKRKGDCIIL